jgi:hypothetical protein
MKRFKTYHGICIPPFRENKKSGKTTTLVFVVTGRIPSKKNELVAIVDRKDAFEYIKTLPDTMTKKECITALFKTYARIKNSLKYEEWENKTVELLKEQQKVFAATAVKNGLIFPLEKVNSGNQILLEG